MFEVIRPKEFFLKFLQCNVRPSGRGLSAIRKTNIQRGSLKLADGSCIVRIGNTTVACGLKLEIGVPSATKPTEGRVDVGVTLSPLCSPKFKVGKQTEEAGAMAETLKKFANDPHWLNLEQLCIDDGRAVWVIYADMMCLNYDGNVGDAMMLALVGALQDLTIPATEVEEDGEVVILEKREQAIQRLVIQYVPVPLTFALLDEYVLADPNAAEEKLSSGTCTIAYTTDGKLSFVKKPGGKALSTDQLKKCMQSARQHADDLADIIRRPIHPNKTSTLTA